MVLEKISKFITVSDANAEDVRAFLPGNSDRGDSAIAGGTEYRLSELLPWDGRTNEVPKLEHIRILPTKVKVLRYLEHVEKTHGGNSIYEGDEKWNPLKSVDFGYVSKCEDMMEQPIRFIGTSVVDEDQMTGGCSVYGAVGDHLCRYSENVENRNVFLRSPASTAGLSFEDSGIGSYQMQMLWSSYASWREYSPLNGDICWIGCVQDREAT